MEELYLYELKSEQEDDPYCQHWYAIDYQTHSYDKAKSKILEWKKIQLSDDSLTLSDLVNVRANSLFFGFLDVSKYDKQAEHYVFDHREYLSKWQIDYSCIDYSLFDKEYLEFFHWNDGEFLEKKFTFPIKAKMVDGSVFDTCIDFTVCKKKLGDGRSARWVQCVEGAKNRHELDNAKADAKFDLGGIYDMTNNYHTETTEGVIEFGHNILTHWTLCNDDLFMKKFNKALSRF